MSGPRELKRSLAQVETAADTWWDLFTMFLSGIDPEDSRPREAVKRAGTLADHALDEYEERWAKKLRDAQELARKRT